MCVICVVVVCCAMFSVVALLCVVSWFVSFDLFWCVGLGCVLM